MRRKYESTIEAEDYIYIGETSRSANERGIEHCKDKEHFRARSHMLKHAVSIHPINHPHEIEFRMKIISQNKTAFERQITEAVLIRRNMGEKLLNSRQEYNQCYIPKITVKIVERLTNYLQVQRQSQNHLNKTCLKQEYRYL